MTCVSLLLLLLLLLLPQVEAHCRAEKEKLLKSDVEKGKVHAGAAGGAAVGTPAKLAGVSGVMHPGAAVMHPGAMPHPVAHVAAAALVTDGEWLLLLPIGRLDLRVRRGVLTLGCWRGCGWI
jgi:hypothetical protein